MTKPLTILLLTSICALSAMLAVAGHYPAIQFEQSAGRPFVGNGIPIGGVVAYERPTGVFVTDLQSGKVKLIAENARYPRWSPDGAYLAFLRSNTVMRVNRDGTEVEILAEAQKARAVAYHPNGEEILFADRREIKSVSLKDHKVRIVVPQDDVRELDISFKGDRLVTTIKKPFSTSLFGFAPPGTDGWKISKGCSASLSPDAEFVTNNSKDHLTLIVRKWPSGDSEKVLNAPPGLKFDNQFWSNHKDWIASRSEGKNTANIYLLQVSANKAFQVTTAGDCDRPDLFVEAD